MKHDHPDADLLTAFGEGNLRLRERDQVLTHLAECADCREILVLASAPAEQPASVHSVYRVWRWAAAMAALALILTATWGLRLVLRAPEKASGIQMTAALKPEVAASAPLPVPKAAPQTKKLKRERRAVIQPKRFVPEAAQVAVPPPAPAPAADSQEPAAADELTKSVVLPVAPAPAPAIAPERGASLEELAKSPGQFGGRSRYSFGRMAGKTAKAKEGVMWRIGTASVERSSDGGITWGAVRVSAGAVFHAVAADGSDVWAGGSHGALFHSSDGGFSWVHVPVREEGRELSGGIIAIRLPQPSEIVLESDSGEEWISRDGGAEWRML